MNSEKLHDAIGLLPSDLITETDRLRCAKPRVIPWKRYAAMAACFAVVLGCSMFAMQVFAPKGATEAAAEAPAAAAPMEQAAPLAPAADAAVSEESAAEAPAVNGASGNSSTPKDSAAPATREPEETVQDTSVIFCQRVETPVEATAACFSSESSVTLVTSRGELEAYLTNKDWIYDFTDLLATSRNYDEDWFAAHDLLLLTVHAAYPDVPYAVTSIESTGGNDPKGWDWYVFYTTAAESHPEGKTTCFHLLTELEKGLIDPEDSILTIADPTD